MKRGRKVKRKDWNGENQHIELATAISYKNTAGRGAAACQGHRHQGARRDQRDQPFPCIVCFHT
ncbi:MAG: DUF2829 domain-containing protein [Clostridiales bacterium]|nr:DUF2829 domain-containing protein [Clostridiales bacterium]